MLRRLASLVIAHRRFVMAAWGALIVTAAIGAVRLPAVLQGASDGIPGSRSVVAIERAVAGGIPAGTFFPFLIVLSSESLTVAEPAYQRAAESVAERLRDLGAVRTFWTTGRSDLVSEDEHTTVLVLRPNVDRLSNAEMLTPLVRQAVADAGLPGTIRATVTGTPPMFFDLDRQSSADLLSAEQIGLPITLVILLIAFAAPLAAGLPVLLAVAGVTVSAAALVAMSFFASVSVFSENVVSMIGLGVGVDYALFVVTSYRGGLARGLDKVAAARHAIEDAGHTVVVSGLAVAAGFSALFLVNVPFLRSMAAGGIVVVLTSVVASLTLLPAILAVTGAVVNWPLKAARGRGPGRVWTIWAAMVMTHRWKALLIGTAVLAVFMAPVVRLQLRSVGVEDLAPDLEARRGFDRIERDFSKGAIGPAILLIDSPDGHTVWEPEMRAGISAMAERLRRDPRVAAVNGFPEVVTVAEDLGTPVTAAADLPAPFAALARDVVSADGRVALLFLLPRSAPESPNTMALVDALRHDRWPEFTALHPDVLVSGASALTSDFDEEIVAGMWVVVPVVLVATFVVLVVAFRSVVVPLKAIALNLASVLASYGFLIYVFQDGLGAATLGLIPPGGLNAFIVLVLFTVLFGLSMDYEVFLLSAIRDAYARTGDNERAVAAGLERTAGTISSAALVMVSIFASFGFTRLMPTRQLGIGLAFAVALDATLVRLVLVPALMSLLGDWNWTLFQRPMKPLVTDSMRRPASIDATSLDTEASTSASGRR